MNSKHIRIKFWHISYLRHDIFFNSLVFEQVYPMVDKVYNFFYNVFFKYIILLNNFSIIDPKYIKSDILVNILS